MADQHPPIVAAVADALTRDGIAVVGQAATGGGALEQIELLGPDVALVGSRLPDMEGAEIAERAAGSARGTAVAIYTESPHLSLVLTAFERGARGFILKTTPLPELTRIVRIIAGGGGYVDPRVAADLLSAEADGPLPSRREREVLQLLADGFNTIEIGRKLELSIETVRTHLRRSMDKLDAKTRAQAISIAMRRSLIR